MTTPTLPQPDSSTAHVHSETGKPTKDFYNWLRTVSDSIKANSAAIAGSLATVLLKANNLSDLASVSTARTNLGLGTAATLNAGTAVGNLVQMASGPKLPAVDGSALTGITSGQPIPTTSTLPVGAMALCILGGSGLSIANGSTTAGSNLTSAVIFIEGLSGNNFLVFASGSAQSGTWKNISGQTLLSSSSGSSINVGGYWVRTA